MVKLCHSFVLFSAAHAREDAEAMLQMGNFAPTVLTQTDSKTLSAVASRHQQALQMESNLEKLAAEAVRTGETPSLGTDARAAVTSALDTLEGELKKEKIANDVEMVGANAQCASCNTAQKNAFTKKGVGVDALASTVEKARSKHATCRGTEDPNCGDEKTTCVDQDTYAEVAHGAGPQCPCKAYDTAATMKDCLQKALDWGKKYNTVLGDKIQACDKAKEVAKKVAKTCDKDQTNFEMAFCSYDVLVSTTCQSHSGCYEAAVRNRGIVMTNLKAKEASEKIMWKSVKKVRCYLDMLDATQVSQEKFDTCKKHEAGVGHLDVTYLAAPAKTDCDTTPVMTVPGDAAWLKTEYAKLAPKQSWLPKRKGIEKVSPCPKLQPPQPIVKPQPKPIVVKCMSKTVRDVCLHASGDIPGHFSLPRDMSVSEVIFTHKSGGLTCAGGAQGALSNFGCGQGLKALVIIKKGNKKDVLMPLASQKIKGFQRTAHKHAHWYTIQGVGQKTAKMHWKFGIQQNLGDGDYEVWYNEDLSNGAEEDNAGRACFDVEILC